MMMTMQLTASRCVRMARRRKQELEEEEQEEQQEEEDEVRTGSWLKEIRKCVARDLALAMACLSEQRSSLQQLQDPRGFIPIVKQLIQVKKCLGISREQKKK